MRLRVSRRLPDPSGGQHLLVTPYKYGLALEYRGVVECWVKDWSIHNHSQGGDDSGARLWVGNNDDTGGLLVTAFRRGDRRYAELVAQTFGGESGGDLRFVVRSRSDAFDFCSGSAGEDVPRMRVTGDGDVVARLGQSASVRVGAAGPDGQPGIAFGGDSPGRFYLAGPGLITTDERLIAKKGLGVGTTRPATRLGRLRRVMDVFDDRGAPLGVVPVYEAPR